MPERTANNLNNDLKEIDKWAFQWEMSFSPTKQAQEVVFSRKTTKKIHPKIFFRNILVSEADSQKHLGLVVDSKLYFNILIFTRNYLKNLQGKTLSRVWFRVPAIQKMVSKLFLFYEIIKKRITIMSLSSNSKGINFIFYS